MTDADREPPRLQDTTERSALPLPLPDEPPRWGARTGEETPEAATEAQPADKAPAVPEPEPEPVKPEPTPAAPAAEPPPVDASTPTPQPSPFSTSTSADAGPRPEVLVGAAFVGGLALALLFRRLGR